MGDVEDLKSETKEKQEEINQEKETFKEVLTKVKDILGDKVKEVRLSSRLTSSPSCIVVEEGQMTSQMQRIMKNAGQAVHVQPILELNPHHLLVKRLQTESNDKLFNDLSVILLDQAILAEGGQLDDPAMFAKKFNELLLSVAEQSPS